jgi:hypothetical protein
MASLDSVILDLTERCCRGFQRLTGRTSVWLAVQLTNLSIVVYFVWAAMYAVVISVAARVVLAAFCAGLLYTLTQTLFKVPIESSEAAAYQRVAKGLRNPRRVRDAPLRISFLTTSVLLIGPAAFLYLYLHRVVFALGYSLIPLTTGVLYLLACDPLPPAPGLARQWISALWRVRAAETS